MSYDIVMLRLSVCSCLIIASAAFTEEMTASMGGSVIFTLPPVTQCAPYKLLDSRTQLVLTVDVNGHCNISALYNFRGSVKMVDQSPVFTLAHVTPTDKGGFKVEPMTRLSFTKRECEGFYFLTVPSANGFWEDWGPWSACSVTCDAGYRLRQRYCNVESGCHTGTATEKEACRSERCLTSEWYPWQSWGSCSVTCGRGLRQRKRQCVDSNRRPSASCPGNSTHLDVCYLANCPTFSDLPSQDVTGWNTWQFWTVCSVSCGGGIRQRIRQCVDSNRRPSNTCTGNKTQFDVCNIAVCPTQWDKLPEQTGERPSAGAASSDTVSLPLSAIVGGSAGFVMLILLCVIVILLIRLSKRKRRREPHPVNRRRKPQNNSPRISETPISSHTYAEIPEDGLEKFGKDRERQPSTTTIDNPYVGLPDKSRMPSGNHLHPDTAYRNLHEKPTCAVNVEEKSIYYNNPNINTRTYPEDKFSYAVPINSLR